MRLSQLVALALSAALFAVGCEKCFKRESGCCPAPTTAAAPPCACNAPAGPYAPVVTTPPPGAIIQH